MTWVPIVDVGVENVVIHDECGIRLLKYLVMIYGPVIMLSDRSAQTPAPPAPASRRVSPALFKRQRLLLRMATYRPLAVLASIWVVLLAIALLAYGQLLRTAPDSREQSTPPSPEVYPHERLQDDSPPAQTAPAPITTETPASDAAPAASTDPVDGERDAASSTPSTGMTIWTLLALVGTCALGSWLLSIQLKRPPKPRSPRQPAQPSSAVPQPVARSATKPTPTARPMRQRSRATPAAPAGPQRLAPYDPHTPIVQAPPQTPSQSATVANPADPATKRVPPPSPAEVAVVRDDVQHRLDWPDDSLVNTADMRQQRSLSSFM